MIYKIVVFEDDVFADETIYIDIDSHKYKLEYIKELLRRDLLDGNYVIHHDEVKYYLSGKPGTFTNREHNRELAAKAQQDFDEQLGKINRLEKLLKYFRDRDMLEAVKKT